MIEFENYIKANIPNVKSFHPHYQKALKEILTSGGKRFRPRLIFSLVNAYQKDMLSNSFAVAFAFECLHTYSLIHDDLPSMDNADTRRGKPTLHKTYDEVTAILVGDALNTHSFYLLSNANLRDDVKIELISLLSSCGGTNGMVLGQAIDCYFENLDLSLEQLEFMHLKKTGELIAASLKAGAIICDFSNDQKEKIYALGLKLGLLFQLQDDIIDVSQTSTQAGKPTGNDTNKNTFIKLLGLEKSLEKKELLVKEILNLSKSFNTNFQENLHELIKKYL